MDIEMGVHRDQSDINSCKKKENQLYLVVYWFHCCLFHDSPFRIWTRQYHQSQSVSNNQRTTAIYLRDQLSSKLKWSAMAIKCIACFINQPIEWHFQSFSNQNVMQFNRKIHTIKQRANKNSTSVGKSVRVDGRSRERKKFGWWRVGTKKIQHHWNGQIQVINGTYQLIGQ